ncbi:MAG: hypothetical protein K6G12_10920 [Lachnospiraceae bacterium]|nr:hypothetical protein [Lachnospiraceae bacterium]
MSVERKQATTGVNVGTSSLLLVFVVMCLVSFATLATVSARADEKLNTKIVERSESYYNACNEAEERLKGIDATLKKLYDSGLDKDEYFEQAGENIEFAIPVSDVQTLNINVEVSYPEADGDTFYKVTKWKLETTGTLIEEEEPKLNLLF